MIYNSGINDTLFKANEIREGDIIKVRPSDGVVRSLLVQLQGADIRCSECAMYPSSCLKDRAGSLLCCTGHNFMKFIAMEDLI